MAFVSGWSASGCTRGHQAVSARTSAFTGAPVVQRVVMRAAAPTTVMGPSAEMERTFVAVKPDGTNRGVVGDIISRFEKRGYKLVALKALKPSKDLAKTHYEALSSKPFYDALVEFICSGLVVAMVWEGKNVVATARKMIGATNPQESNPGTIRGDYAVDVGRNVIHGSDAVQTAEREIKLWFKDEEVVEWDRSNDIWVYE
eukprot:Plantae.Rhodophyta-Purpureofilum_apyrenoidigerum.ctg40575.p1 GENE.Plantae.Rhodophyta-Purpureofilum_apyrenoidigerum.ctg40575~~Plantae.Rhodophyta-Purpureofilum_apyrenoidigerum.ctg40575.p1  ORF type:complete len:225 (-),score=39.68 Plantae.Rhodophyta-Purpureofilum_apyrenoidigerum.ctg40575:107-709(-)